MAIGLGVLWLVVGTVIAVVGWAAASDRLPPRHWAGIRLPSTTRSEPAWYAAHRAAAPILQGGGGLIGATGLMLMVFRPDEDTVALTTLVLTVSLVAVVVSAGAVGAAAARAHERV